ncbi:PGCA protein, partial [Atractosteus spatula]|nr:PGCA protein [Atractosteus spatula]
MGNISLYSQTGSNFTSWDTGQPGNNGGKENCGIMASSGLWHDYPCSSSFYFICYQDSGDPAKRYFLINATANFTAAQRYCREHHTDLASARNRSENEEVRLTAQGNYVWIGLFMEPWKWSSPSYSAFYNWDQNQPDNAGGNENCAALALTGSTRGRWSDTDCAQRFPFFCFSENRVVLKVSIRLSKRMNLNDPGVSEFLLNQMRGLLSRHTVMNRTSLKWKEQKDGQVFHPEEDEGEIWDPSVPH